MTHQITPTTILSTSLTLRMVGGTSTLMSRKTWVQTCSCIFTLSIDICDPCIMQAETVYAGVVNGQPVGGLCMTTHTHTHREIPAIYPSHNIDVLCVHYFRYIQWAHSVHMIPILELRLRPLTVVLCCATMSKHSLLRSLTVVPLLVATPSLGHQTAAHPTSCTTRCVCVCVRIHMCAYAWLCVSCVYSRYQVGKSIQAGLYTLETLYFGVSQHTCIHPINVK